MPNLDLLWVITALIDNAGGVAELSLPATLFPSHVLELMDVLSAGGIEAQLLERPSVLRLWRKGRPPQKVEARRYDA